MNLICDRRECCQRQGFRDARNITLPYLTLLTFLAALTGGRWMFLLMGPIARVVETHSSVRLCEPVKQTLTITVLDQF